METRVIPNIMVYALVYRIWIPSFLKSRRWPLPAKTSLSVQLHHALIYFMTFTSISTLTQFIEEEIGQTLCIKILEIVFLRNRVSNTLTSFFQKPISRNWILKNQGASKIGPKNSPNFRVTAYLGSWIFKVFPALDSAL